jgi:hypothetical protein
VGYMRSVEVVEVLPDSKFLIQIDIIGVRQQAEPYDPGMGTWNATGTLSTAREIHTAVLLPNGRVVVAAGRNVDTSARFASAEVYDYAMGSWSAPGGSGTPRESYTTMVLPNGKVLVA